MRPSHILGVAALAALLAACAPAQRTAAADPADALADSLGARLRQQAESGFSGVVLVARDGGVVLREAYGPDVTPESPFWIGSVSKTVTAAAVLRLRDGGRLALTDSLPQFFDGVPPDKREITVRHLLTHTAGLGENYAADGVADRAAAVRSILAPPLTRAPGEGYGYTNDAYTLLAAVVEVASGQPFEAYLREHVLRPAGMNQTGFWGGPNPGGPLAPSGTPEAPGPNWGFRGATGLSSTADDLYRWHLALLGDAVLPDRTRREAFAPQVDRSSGRAYGYGWQVVRTPRETTLLAHNGAESGLDHYAYLYRYVDDGVVVVVLSNAPEAVARETLRAVLQAVFAT